MRRIKERTTRIKELEELLAQAERKSDILTNLLKEASAEFNQALEKVSTSESNFRAVFENAPEAIYIIDAQSHQILDCNPFTAEWLGYTREQLLAMKVEDVLNADTEGIPENIRQALDVGRVHIQERRFVKSDGSIADAEITGTQVIYEGKTCFLALVRDVTERKQIEALSRYKELFENVTDPVFIINQHGRFMEINDVACSSLGFTREQMLAMRLKDVVLPDQWNVLHKMAEGLVAHKTVQSELHIQPRNGVPIPFEIHSKRIHFKGKPAVLGVARNTSIRKKMEETLVKTERLLAVGEMASGVAHNFNNLLQMILGGGEVALAKLDDGKIRECREALENILNACGRGSGIVRRIKDFTLSQSNGMDQAQVFDLEELVTEAMELTKPLWKTISEPRKYRINMIKCTRCFVKGKPTEIYEVLINIIKNALEAMPEGGVLNVSGSVHNDSVQLQISDTGHGIQKEDLQRIFEPFFTTKGKKSTGLGLSSSYGIVKRHGGAIYVDSTIGKGTRFTLVFPRAEQVQPQPISETPPATPGRIRFLLIDDEVNILRFMEMFFEDTEIDIRTANSAGDGIRAVHEDDFDIILCDYGMDDMSGLEVGEAVKFYCETNGRAKVPFMLYTGLDQKLESAKLTAAGVDRVVHKPITCEDLLGIIRTVVTEQKHPVSTECALPVCDP